MCVGVRDGGRGAAEVPELVLVLVPVPLMRVVVWVRWVWSLAGGWGGRSGYGWMGGAACLQDGWGWC